jgi:hypothetical protein
MDKVLRQEIGYLCVELPRIEARLRGAGLLATAVKMNEAVREIGYEAERLIVKAQSSGDSSQ